MQVQERRSEGIARIPVETVVELCGRDGDVPAFEAACVEVSGRGMHVKGDYLPDVGAPLVLRFELGGEEVTAEGEVAWKNPTPTGGEFGICFTALDSASVLALKRLNRGELVAPRSDNPLGTEASTSSRPNFEIPEGAPVRLHLQGLGAPMKARVFRQGQHRLHVGSELEFLTVGRPIELQPAEGEEKRTAEIDAVSVVIDPISQIPQLVVSLRVAGACQRTPEPSGVEASAVARANDGVAEQHGEGNEPALGDSMSDQLDAWVVRLGDWTKRCGESCARGSSRALGALATSVKPLGEGRRRFSQRLAASSSRPRRTTSPVRSAQRYSSRRQPAAESAGGQRELGNEARLGRQARSKRRVATAAGFLTLGALVSWGLLGSNDEPAVVLQAVKAHADLPAPMAPLAPAAPGSLPQAESQVIRSAVQPVQALTRAEQLPLVDSAGRASPERSPAPEEDEFGAADDETFADNRHDARGESETSDVAPWGRGRLHLPIVHRIRLDKPATKLEGVETATGFRVLLAGRQVLENGRGIEKRDDRITQVTTKNDPDGARIEFRFQKGIPPYKVRVRDSAVEFFISAD